MLKFIKEINASQQQNFKLPVGNYAGLIFVNDGNIDLGIASGSTDFASYYILKGGEPITFARLDELKELNNILYGMPVLTFVAGDGTTTKDKFTALQLFNPFTLLAPKSTILNVEKEDNITVQFIPKTITSGNLLVYGEIAESGAQNYQLNINRQVIQGAGRLAEDLSGENFMALYIIPGSNATRIMIEKDGNSVVNAEKSVLIANTEMFNRIESGSLNSCFIDLAPLGAISEALNDNVRMIVDHSSTDTTVVYTFTATFDIAKTQASVVKQQVVENTKIEKKFNATSSPVKKEIIQKIHPAFNRANLRVNKRGGRL